MNDACSSFLHVSAFFVDYRTNSEILLLFSEETLVTCGNCSMSKFVKSKVLPEQSER